MHEALHDGGEKGGVRAPVEDSNVISQATLEWAQAHHTLQGAC